MACASRSVDAQRTDNLLSIGATMVFSLCVRKNQRTITNTHRTAQHSGSYVSAVCVHAPNAHKMCLRCTFCVVVVVVVVVHYYAQRHISLPCGSRHNRARARARRASSTEIVKRVGVLAASAAAEPFTSLPSHAAAQSAAFSYAPKMDHNHSAFTRPMIILFGI